MSATIALQLSLLLALGLAYFSARFASAKLPFAAASCFVMVIVCILNIIFAAMMPAGATAPATMHVGLVGAAIILGAAYVRRNRHKPLATRVRRTYHGM